MFMPGSHTWEDAMDMNQDEVEVRASADAPDTPSVKFAGAEMTVDTSSTPESSIPSPNLTEGFDSTSNAVSDDQSTPTSEGSNHLLSSSSNSLPSPSPTDQVSLIIQPPPVPLPVVDTEPILASVTSSQKPMTADATFEAGSESDMESDDDGDYHSFRSADGDSELGGGGWRGECRFC